MPLAQWPLGLGVVGLSVVLSSMPAFLPTDAVRMAAGAFEGPVRADVIEVVDGDTFRAAAHIWLAQTVEVHVRIDGIDAPELHAKCTTERLKAEVARGWLERRIGNSEVRLIGVKNDKYGGRIRASVEDSKGDIAKAMLRQGLVRAYHGGRRAGWCNN